MCVCVCVCVCTYVCVYVCMYVGMCYACYTLKPGASFIYRSIHTHTYIEITHAHFYSDNKLTHSSLEQASSIAARVGHTFSTSTPNLWMYVCVCMCMYACMYVYVCVYVSQSGANPLRTWAKPVNVCECVCFLGISVWEWEWGKTSPHLRQNCECMFVCMYVCTHKCEWEWTNSLHIYSKPVTVCDACECVCVCVCIYIYIYIYIYI